MAKYVTHNERRVQKAIDELIKIQDSKISNTDWFAVERVLDSLRSLESRFSQQD